MSLPPAPAYHREAGAGYSHIEREEMVMVRTVRPKPATKPAAPVDPTRAKAWRAVQKFNRMIPTLNSFARTLTGNKKLRVQAGPVTCTNKSVVYIRPPIALGDEVRHDRMLCDERDVDRTPLCPACAADDDIWKKLHHELAHHLGDSMAEPTNSVIDDMLKLVDEWHPVGACDHGYRMKLKMQYATDYLELFGAFSGFLEHLSQGMEDARIDSAMLNMKPGLRDQFYSFTYRTFTLGSEQEDGTVQFWRDAPLNAQLVIGCLLVGSGYYIEPGWLSDEAINELQDEKLRSIITSAHAWRDVHVGAARTIQAFLRLHEMGHLQVPRCAAPVEPPPSLNKPGDDGEESDDALDDDQPQDETPGEPGDGDDEPAGEQPDADESDDGPGDDAGDPTGDGTAGDTASDGAFGDDFENEDDRSSGSDQQGGSDDAESEGASVPNDDGDDSSDESGSPESSDGSDDEDAVESEGDDPSGARGEATSEGTDDAGDTDPEEGGKGGAGSPAPAGDAGTDGDDTAQDGAGDGDGEPSSEDGDAQPGEGDPEGEGDEVLDAEPGGDEESDALGEEVWNEEHDAADLKAARSVEVENPGDEHEVAELMKTLHGHDDTDVQLAERGDEAQGDFDPEKDDPQQVAAIKAAIEAAISQAEYFDTSSQEIGGVKEITFPNADYRWIRGYRTRISDFMPSEATLGKALLIARRVFAENKRSGYERHLRSGRVDGRVLGKRAGLGDDRIFRHKHVPAKRDYVVGITIDCSGSNHTGQRMARAKRAVFAKAELLNRLGVKFYITAHTGGMERWFQGGYSPAGENEMHDLMIMWVKKVEEPWNDDTRTRLANVEPSMENYDGHTLEFHRKMLERRSETDKILIYYTDGAMPAANYEEELVILENEIHECKRKKIALLAVGINTDSPKQYGFDTVQVDSDSDLMKVVEQLERHLLK